MLTYLRSAICVATLLLSSTSVRAQVYLPGSATPFPGSAQAATSQVYHYYNGVPYYQGFYYPGPAGYYPGPFDYLFRTEAGISIPSLIVITPRMTTTITETVVTTPAPAPVPQTLQTATIDVRVPADAVLYVQGKKMSQTGSDRRFVTPLLDEGQIYLYKIKAVWSESGSEHEVERSIRVAAGQQAYVNFLDDTSNGASDSSSR